MNGVLVVDKPKGPTSSDVVQIVRRALKVKKAGHTGTLDPMATGVLPLCLGDATRIAQVLTDGNKAYDATLKLGVTTDTLDAEGAVLQTRAVPTLTRERLEQVFATFRGALMQTPPMYSAKKVGGKKLYDLARQGVTVERKAANVTVSKLEIISPLRPSGDDSGTWDLGLAVRCSAGTYIRTLAEDIGRKLGVGAHLRELRRTAAGKFTISQAITIEELADMPEPADALVSMNLAISHLPAFTVREDRVAKTMNGMSTRVFETGLADREVVRMITEAGGLLAIGFFDAAENVIQPKAVLV